jgi:hypothetical protein
LFQARIQSLHAFRTDAMGELGLGVLANVDFDLVPETLVIANLLAVHADREETVQKRHEPERLPACIAGARLSLAGAGASYTIQRGWHA